jgi:hypothetical protein
VEVVHALVDKEGPAVLLIGVDTTVRHLLANLEGG